MLWRPTCRNKNLNYFTFILALGGLETQKNKAGHTLKKEKKQTDCSIHARTSDLPLRLLTAQTHFWSDNFPRLFYISLEGCQTGGRVTLWEDFGWFTSTRKIHTVYGHEVEWSCSKKFNHNGYPWWSFKTDKKSKPEQWEVWRLTLLTSFWNW